MSVFTMEVAYNFTERDVALFYHEYSVDWHKSKSKRKPQNKVWVVLYYFSLLVVPVLVFAFTAGVGAGYDIAVIAGLTTGVVWRWPLNFLWSIWQRSRLRASPQFFGPHVVSTSLKGLADQRPEGEWVAYWSHLADIRKTKHFFLFLYQNRAVVPVPQHAFRSSEEADQFYRQSHEYWKLGHGVWPPAPVASNSAEPSEHS